MRLPFSPTAKAIAAKCSDWIGEACLLYRFENVLFYGIVEDDTDVYYVVNGPKRHGFLLASSVGHLEPLKPHLPEEIYVALHENLLRNHPDSFSLDALKRTPE